MTNLGVLGPEQAGPELLHAARAVGAAAACEGARAAGGLTVGLLPGDEPDAGNEHLLVALPTGLGQARNALLVSACQGFVAVGRERCTVSWT